MSLRLVERDYQVLELLELWGLLGLGQLEALVFRLELDYEERNRLLFNEGERSSYDGYAYKRLSRLVRAGYLAAFSSDFGIPVGQAYTLTPAGQRELAEVGRSRAIALRRSWSPDTVWHYLEVNGVGLSLERIVKVRVWPKHVLVSMNRAKGMSKPAIRIQTPDMEIGSVSLPLIMPMSHWGAAEFRERWRLPTPRFLGASLYLAGNLASQEGIHAYAREWKADHIYAGIRREFREQLDQAPFVNSAGKVLTLGQILGLS